MMISVIGKRIRYDIFSVLKDGYLNKYTNRKRKKNQKKERKRKKEKKERGGGLIPLLSDVDRRS